MDADTLLQILFRWIHVGTAVVLVGGAAFLRFVVHPSVAPLTEADRDQLMTRIIGRWKRAVMIGIALLLITGFYNYLTVERAPRYHMLMGSKILAALAVFFLASALTGRSAGLAAIRQNSARWMGVLLVLAAVTIAIAGYLKVVFPAPG
jgi:uncharacterized membrane protein